MKIDPRAGQLATATDLVDVAKLIAAYYEERPDVGAAEQRVIFGTSGHRGSSFTQTFNKWHILAITQAICAYRRQQKIDGPLFLGIDTHALSQPAVESALEVLAANAVDVMLAGSEQHTPTPVISHAILTYNRGRTTAMASSSRRRTILQIAGGGLSTTRLMAVRRKRRSPHRLRDRPTSFSPINSRESSGWHHCGPACGRDYREIQEGPGPTLRGLNREPGDPLYRRSEAPASCEQKLALEHATAKSIQVGDLAGERPVTIFTNAPGDGSPISGVKVVAASGWFAARPSGTEAIHKIYAESFKGGDHLEKIEAEAQTIVNKAFAAGNQADAPLQLQETA